MKVLHVTVSSSIGGGPEHIYLLMSGFSNVESHIARPEGAYVNKFSEIVKDKFVLIPKQKFSFISLFRVIQYIKKNKIEIVHSHGKGAAVYARIISLFCRIKYIHTPHGLSPKIFDSISNFTYYLVELLLGWRTDYIIFVSRTESQIAKKFNLWNGVKYTVINNGTKNILNSQKNNWQFECLQELNLSNSKNIVTASRFDLQKNTIEFCRMAILLPEYNFFILGDGPLKNECIDFCQEHNLKNVYFLGAKSNPLKYFSIANVYLSTSLWEGLSMAVIECLSLGVPFILSNVDGNRDFLKFGNLGNLYELGNLDDCKNKLVNLIESNNYQEISENCIKVHEVNFSQQMMCNNTELVYN
jgi:glycosyltransferase involved in cell wall biosynthesis